MTTSIRVTAPLEVHRAQTTVFPDLSRVAESWDTVAAGSGSPMQHFAWASACTDTFAGPSALRVVVLGPPQQPVAIAPLLMRRKGGLPRLELLGLRELYEPMDLIFRNPADAMELAESLAHLGLPLLLARIPAASPTVAALKQAYRGRGVVVIRPAPSYPWIALDRSWSQSEPPLETRRRSDLRRAYRHAEKIGPVRCQILSPAPQELDSLLAEVFRVEAAGWKGQQGTALASDPLRQAFFRRYAVAACRTGILRLCFLRIGDRIAAVQFAVESEDRFWLLKIGYDEAFAKCSPGSLLLWETVRDAATRGLRSYEFLGAPDPWTRVWTERVRPCLSIRAYPARPCGIAALAVDAIQVARHRVSRFLGSGR